jgi:hypothetical protein
MQGSNFDRTCDNVDLTLTEVGSQPLHVLAVTTAFIRYL